MIQEGLFKYNLSDNFTAKIFKEKTHETVNSGGVFRIQNSAINLAWYSSKSMSSSYKVYSNLI